MKKLSKAERRRRTQNARQGYSFYFNFDLDKFNGPGKKKNKITKRMETKWKKEGGPPMGYFKPQKMLKRMHNVSTKSYDERMVDQCCGTITNSDPPKRCTNATMTGEDYCSAHGGRMIRQNREKHLHKYSAEELREQIRDLTKGDLLDIKEEIAVTVIVLKKHVETMVQAEKLDNKSIELFLKIIDSVTKNVERLHKMRYGEDVVSKDDLDRMVANRTKQELEIIDKLIGDDKLKQDLLNAFANITEK